MSVGIRPPSSSLPLTTAWHSDIVPPIKVGVRGVNSSPSALKFLPLKALVYSQCRPPCTIDIPRSDDGFMDLDPLVGLRSESESGLSLGASLEGKITTKRDEVYQWGGVASESKTAIWWLTFGLEEWWFRRKFEVIQSELASRHTGTVGFRFWVWRPVKRRRRNSSYCLKT